MEELQAPKNWWGRNWKWALPAGGGLIVIVLIIVFVVTLVGGVTAMFKESAPYQTAMTKAKESSWVIDRLGEPIEVGGITQGNINLSNGQGTADLKIPLKGPSDGGTLMVWAKKANGAWTYTYIKFRSDQTGEVYDLINDRLLQPESD